MRIFLSGVKASRAGTASCALAALILVALAWVRPAAAQDVQSIAALVNDKVVSAYDLDQRIKLVVATSGLEPTPEALERIREQVLRTLVDEELQLQEAATAELVVPDQEIDLAIARLAQRNGMSRAQILQILAEAGVSENTLRRQIKSSIAWDELTQGRFSSRISVTQEDIDQVLEQLQANSDKPQFWIMEIFLRVDNPDDEDSVVRTAQRLVDQLRTGQASFSEIARQFSQSSTAGSGGDVGWVTADTLPEQVAQAASAMRPGSLSIPIRTIGGYYIIALRDRRVGVGAAPDQITLDLRQLVVPAFPEHPEDYVRYAGGMSVQIASSQPSCEDAEAIAAQSGNQIRFSNLGKRKVTDLTEPFQDAVDGLTSGDVAPPVRSNVGFHVMLVCSRETEGSLLPEREAIEDRLFQQQLSMVQRRYLRDLRRDATIEMRE